MRDLKAVLSLRLLCMLSVCAACLTLSGCGASSSGYSVPVTVSSEPSAPVVPAHAANGAVSGHAQAGQQPVNGGKVYLYAAPTTGYGVASTSLLTNAVLTNNTSATDAASHTGIGGYDGTNYYVATDASGAFSVTGDWTCVAGTDIYFLLVGGNPGGYGTNNSLMMMAALGNCSNVPSFTFMNEVVSAASVYSLAGFMGSPTQVSSASTTASKAGMAAAFATVNNLVNIATGTALSVTPGSSAGASNTGVASFTVTAGGSNYTSTPTVTITGGGYTSQAAATVIVTSKVVTGLYVTSSGAGYTSVPSITWSGGGGSGAAATPVLGNLVTGTPSQANLNTLASILAVCENSAGVTTGAGDGTVCGTLFSDTTITNASGVSVAPTNTVQAALNLAHYPGIIGTTLYGDLMPANAAFSPTLSFAPNDWTMPIVYTGINFNDLYDIAIDGNNNVWAVNDGNNGQCLLVTSATGSGVIKMSNLGVPAAPVYTNADIGCSFGIAIDTSNNAWVVNDDVNWITKISSTGTITGYQKTTTDYLDYPNGLAFDASGNIWITNYLNAYLLKYSVSGNSWTSYSGAAGGMTTSGSGVSWGIAVNGSTGNVYIASDAATGRVDEFNSSGTHVTGTSGYTGAGMAYPLRLALDQGGNVWTANFGASASTAPGCTLSEISSTGTAVSPNAGFGGSCTTTTPGTGGLLAPFGIAVDGNNNVWAANAAYYGVSEYDNSTDYYNGSFLSNEYGFLGTILSPTTSAMYFPESLAVDEAGNVWVANYGVNTGSEVATTAKTIPGSITELVGAAAPTLTPIAAATVAGTPAAKP